MATLSAEYLVNKFNFIPSDGKKKQKHSAHIPKDIFFSQSAINIETNDSWFSLS